MYDYFIYSYSIGLEYGSTFGILIAKLPNNIYAERRNRRKLMIFIMYVTCRIPVYVQ